MFFKKYKLNCGISSQKMKKEMKNPKNCSKIAKKSLFFPLFGKKSFLNQTLGLKKSFLNQTIYVQKKQRNGATIRPGEGLDISFLNENSGFGA